MWVKKCLRAIDIQNTVRKKKKQFIVNLRLIGKTINWVLSEAVLDDIFVDVGNDCEEVSSIAVDFELVINIAFSVGLSFSGATVVVFVETVVITFKVAWVLFSAASTWEEIEDCTKFKLITGSTWFSVFFDGEKEIQSKLIGADSFLRNAQLVNIFCVPFEKDIDPDT